MWWFSFFVDLLLIWLPLWAHNHTGSRPKCQASFYIVLYVYTQLCKGLKYHLTFEVTSVLPIYNEEKVIMDLPGSLPSSYWSPYWICTQYPTKGHTSNPWNKCPKRGRLTTGGQIPIEKHYHSLEDICCILPRNVRTLIHPMLFKQMPVNVSCTRFVDKFFKTVEIVDA